MRVAINMVRKYESFSEIESRIHSHSSIIRGGVIVGSLIFPPQLKPEDLRREHRRIDN